MEVINIDSSDDEGVPKARAAFCRAAEHRLGIAASSGNNINNVTQTQSIQSDDSSVSSSVLCDVQDVPSKFKWNDPPREHKGEVSDIQVAPWKRKKPSFCEPEDLPSKSTKNDTLYERNVSIDSGSEGELEKVGMPAKTILKKGDSGDENKFTSLDDELPPEAPLPVGATWRVVLLMDEREFGNSTNFLQETKKKIDKHFGGTYSDIETLPSADYMFAARLISDSTGEVVDERLLDMVIERKCVVDLAACLVAKSKKYRPLSFFDAQMYKFQQNGIPKKLFVMEGDEDKKSSVFAGAFSKMEKMIRLKRIKTTRLQLERGEWAGVEIMCTRNKRDTINFLIQQLKDFQKSFDPRRPPTKTMKQLKSHINERMKMPTFQEYLRLRKIGGIGVVKAMKVILDPNLDWDKSFVSPEGTSRPSKSTLEDRATFWPDAKAPTKKKPGSINPDINKMAASISKCQQAVKDFDESAEGKERKALDNKRKNSKIKMTLQDCNDLDALNRQRESLVLERNEAKRGKNDDEIASAVRALADFDASENGGKKRSKLMQKKRHSQLIMSNDDFATLSQLNEKRNALADEGTYSQPSVTECRKALREFDESAEGKERRALDEKSKNSKKKMTPQESAELDELNRRRGLLAQTRNAAKREGNNDALASSVRALTDFDASKSGRNRLNLMTKNRFSQLQMSAEEVAKLKALNEKRGFLASKLFQFSSTDPESSNEAAAKSKTKSLARGTTSATLSKKRANEKRKEPPEQLVKCQKTDQQSSGAHAKTDAEDEEAMCGICFKSIDIWVDENVVLCNRVAACGATFHESCLTAHDYDVNAHDGCIMCQPKSKFKAESKEEARKNGPDDGAFTVKCRQTIADVIVLESDDEVKEDDDVIVLD